MLYNKGVKMRDVHISENNFHFKIKASGVLMIDGKIFMIYWVKDFPKNPAGAFFALEKAWKQQWKFHLRLQTRQKTPSG